ncbi:hypothetical protein PC129_g22081 [Phytophthora cactorum]|uniref:Retrotransposon gag domain-containing protein n=1 Tax=Phytophthora cactorum TaxID=29920 RepID=A0A8T1H459_9STRA|nr:hypothetical protein PC113_g23628 [Phytophthora cactorum]KAG2872142.1 hypothetical protein PC114_g26544 [Phytophthora cactorum]KAG3048251.1 hypothetical protein PC122_g23872 [Phytophthora cactorum]KAG3205498.1 hypothetical protein PC129_g22081 [Phytophthora cactorum]
MKNDEWMQLFKPIPKRKAEWPAFAHELQYPVNSVSTSQVAEDSVSLLLALGYENEAYPSTMSLQDWNPHEARAALQKWKKKLRKTFGAIGINEGKQPVSRMVTLEEDPSKVPLPATPKRLERTSSTKRGADRDAFGTADASPYLQDSHMVTSRSTSRMRRMDAEDEGSRSRRGGVRASKNSSRRRQTHTGASSSDDDDLLPPAYDDEDSQAELTRQMREITALNDSDPTPRIEMASHRPLDRIKPFSGSRNKSENSMQWLRTFVYEMTGTHTEADKWCIPFELSLRDGAIHWFRQLPKKTKRTWKLLSNAFIRYYCSQFTQTALSRYYSAKRERSEHLCNYLNRLNGYARNARLQFEKGGRDAKEHVQQFLVTCGDDNMAESLYHTRVNDIHELEEIIEDILKGKELMAKRNGVIRHSRSRGFRRDEPHDRQSRRDRQLEGREATRCGTERSDGEHHAHEDDQDEYDHYQSDDASSDGSLVDNDRHLVAANEGERRAAAEGTYARSDNRPPRGNIPDRERGFNQDRRSGERTFNQDRRGGERSFNQDSRGRRDFNRDNRRPQYGPCAVCGGMSHSAHYCNKRCMFCKQAHDAGQCELFRNFQDLAKFVHIKGTKDSP